MATIIPRWEWRTFGTRLGRAKAVFAGLEPTDDRESEEVYLLTVSQTSNIKIRDDLLDIKTLQEVNAAGLEQWMPIAKEGFPMSAAAVAGCFRALKVTPPALERDAYTLEQFMAEIIAPRPLVHVLNVHKRRRRYTIGGCMSELTDVTAATDEAPGDVRQTQTIAVELADAEAVVAAVRSLGLADYVNTSYTRGLYALLDGSLPRYAIIDVGTNSVKFHVAESTEDNAWRVVADRAELTRLGEGLEKSGTITQEAMERTAAAIAGMVEEAKHDGCLAITAVGTAGLRIAGNGDEVVEAIRERTGVTIEIISGEEEGRLAYLAVRAGLPLGDGSLVVFDTGGGSSQFTFGRENDVLERFSVDVGAVRYTERFGLSGAVTPEVLTEAMAAISADLSRIDGRPRPDSLAGMGGAITNLTAVSYEMAKYDPDVIQGTILRREEIERQIELYRSTPLEARRAIVGLQPKRADVILAGACIVLTIMDKLGRDTLTVSDRGLRHGLLAERFGE